MPNVPPEKHCQASQEVLRLRQGVILIRRYTLQFVQPTYADGTTCPIAKETDCQASTDARLHGLRQDTHKTRLEALQAVQ
jgi:hypothetical protein